MSVAFSLAEVAGDEAPEQRGSALGKGQKRKMNKNTLPANPQLVETSEQSTLNPHAQLRQRLVKEGYSEDEVDRSMEEMWERNLHYDDFNEVLSFLRARNADKDQSEAPPSEEETKTASTAESASTATNNDRRHRADDSVDESEKSEGAIDIAGFVDDAHAPGPTRHRNRGVHPLNMSSKLDLVADYENLADAAFALSEWVAKAADRDEIHELCASHKSRALPTVMRRTIAETADNTKFHESVLPSMLHLIGSIFLNAGMSSTAASATRKSLEAVMKLARRASMTKEESEQVFADRVARYIVSRISEAIDDLKSHGNDEGVDLILRLEDEIESLASSLATGEGGVIELITKRDTNKTAAEKSNTVVGVAMATTFRGFEMPMETGESSVDKTAILLSLVGKSGVENMKTHKQVHEDLSLRVSSMTASKSGDCARLRSNLDTYNAERSLVAERMEELRMAMRQLEEDDAELCQRIDETELEMSELFSNQGDEMQQLTGELKETQKVVEFEATIDSLADGLKVYEESLKKAVTVSNIFENCDNVNEFVPSKLGVYLVHVKNYFTSESECVDFLRKRVVSLERDSRDLKREIEECRAMGMSATVSQMSDALSLNRQNISDDKGVVDGLLIEAQNMMSNLIGRLDQFISDDNIQQQKHELSPLHVSLVRGIAGTVEMMGLEDIGRLKAFLPNSNVGDLPTVVTTSHDESDELDGSDTDLEVCSADGVDFDGAADCGTEGETETACASEVDEQNTEDDGVPSSSVDHDDDELGRSMNSKILSEEEEDRSLRRQSGTDMLIRRLTWARPDAQPAKKPTVKSLLDIQKEELSCRGQDRADGT